MKTLAPKTLAPKTPAMNGAIGLIGGTGWPSTALYYERLNRLAEPGTVPVLIASLSFAPVLADAEQGRFDLVTAAFVQAAQALDAAGAGVIGLCAATAHLAFDAVADAVAVPCLHIAEPFRRPADLLPAGASIGVLGTAQTLEQGVFAGPLAAAGHRVLSPEGALAAGLDRAIKTGISSGRPTADDIAAVQAALDDLTARGAACVVLGCTELPLIRDRLNTELPLIDAVAAHCRALLAARPI
ncbi:aspartate/glutamate racemase family protein [uncultured Tistrella sp.]|uniref:aspartate/glutamate racemase family protein n=1 Tax=Tistrella mobilis TaxID=171437 RepID=UPI0026396EB8|nr:aspartate/glutamate racemase family protein [uncultured Tistrella sp.]